MTELHAGLAAFRDQLRDAIERDLGHRAKHRRAPALRIAAPAAVTLTAAAAIIATQAFSGASVSAADAAILHHVADALAPAPGTILHERAIVTLGSQTAPYELWADGSAPFRYRVSKWGHEGTGSGQPTNDFAAELREMVQDGNAAVSGSTTIDGVAAYKLTVQGGPDRFLNGTAYVAQSDYHPLVIDTTANGGELIRFQTYEYLPATQANLALLHTSGS
jgi:hypothetical protein